MKSLFLLLALAFALPCAAQSVPATINYQGRLTDNTPQQNPVTATVAMSFELWDCAACATPAPDRLWAEPASGTVPVAVSGGIFSVRLGGNGVAIPPTTFSGGTQRWLQIYANGEALAPRQLLTATGYANQADNAATAASAVTAITATTANNANNLGGVAAGGYQLATVQNCGAGQFVSAIGNGSATCATPASGVPNPLSLTQASGAVTITGINTGSGPGLLGQSAAQNGVIGRTNSATDSGVYGENDNGGYGVSGLTNGNGAAVIGTNNGAGSAVMGVNNGTGPAGVFQLNNSANASPAVSASTYSPGAAVMGVNNNLGPAGVFVLNQGANASPAISAATSGTGSGLEASASGGGAGVSATATGGYGAAVKGVNAGYGSAGDFQVSNAANASPAISASTAGAGPGLAVSVNGGGGDGVTSDVTIGNGTAVYGGTAGNGFGGSFEVYSATSTGTGLFAKTQGTGPAARITSANTSATPLQVEAFYAGQTAKLQRWMVGGAEVASVSPAGVFTGSGAGLTSLNPGNLGAGTAGISITGNAGTVSNGVYTTGSYANPAWITSLAGAKITGTVASAANATQLGGVAPSGYQLATVQSCAAGQFLSAITAAGGTSCTAPPFNNLSPPILLSAASASPILTATNSGVGFAIDASSGSADAIHGTSTAVNGNGVYGLANNGSQAYGVYGQSAGGAGVYGQSASGVGVYGASNTGDGVSGYSSSHNGVVGITASAGDSGVYAANNGQGRAAYFSNFTAGSTASTVAVYTATLGSGIEVQTNNATNSSPAVTIANNGTGPGVYATETGAGYGGEFYVNNPANSNDALVGGTNGHGAAVSGFNSGTGAGLNGSSTGTGNAGYFQVNNAASGAAALYVNTNGTGDGVNSTSAGHNGVAGSSGSANDSGIYGTNTGLGRAALFQIGNAANSSAALYASTSGTGAAINGVANGGGAAGGFQIFNTSNPNYALYASTLGTGYAGYFIINNGANASAALYATTNGTGPAGYFGGNVTVTGKATSAATVAGDPATTLVTKGYVDGAATIPVPLSLSAASGSPIISGSNTSSGPGLNASSTSGTALTVSAGGDGITVTSAGTDGIIATNTLSGGNGIHGVANVGSNAWAVFGQSSAGHAIHAVTTTGLAGFFSGNVQVVGSLSKSSGSFKIDHPLDPANKYLYHSFVESPDMMNIYNGNITTDAAGEAVVVLPDWFGALNREFRYQLTVIGEFAQAIVGKKIENNRFTIRTSKPGVEVSWQVTGIRHDAYAEAHRIPVEQEKPPEERGTFLHPAEQGQPAEKALGYDKRGGDEPARSSAH